MFMRPLLFVCVWLSCLPQSEPSAVSIQLEELIKTNGLPSCRVYPRSGASNDRTVWLFQSDSLSFDFCLKNNHEVLVSDVTMSNDGGRDRISVDIDGEKVGDVLSRAGSMYGMYWNVFSRSGPVGATRTLSSGQHTLTLTVEDADIHGVELDNVQLGFGGSLTADDIRCQRPPDRDMKRPASDQCRSELTDPNRPKKTTPKKSTTRKTGELS